MIFARAFPFLLTFLIVFAIMSGANDISPASRPVYRETLSTEKYDDEKDMQISPVDAVHHLDAVEESHIKQ